MTLWLVIHFVVASHLCCILNFYIDILEGKVCIFLKFTNDSYVIKKGTLYHVGNLGLRLEVLGI